MKTPSPSAWVVGKILAIALAFFSPFTIRAATYYVSSSDPNANDSYVTPTSTQPWKTIAKINATAFAPGDTIYFKCGDTWREMLKPSTAGNATVGPVTFTSYGTGNKPIICGADVITGWTAYAAGTANTYYTPFSSGTTAMVTSDSNYLFTKSGASATTLLANEYVWTSGTLYLNIGANPTSHLIEAARRDHAIDNSSGIGYIKIEGLQLEKSNLCNIHINLSTNWTVQDCNLFFGNSNTSESGGGVHADGAHYLFFDGNHINYSLGDGVMAWQSHNVTVSNNLIENVLDDGGNPGADGIQIGAPSTSPTACNNFTITNNVVTRPSDSVNKGCIIAEMGDNGVISGNTCTFGRFGIAPAGNNVLVKDNYITEFGNGGGIRISQNMPLSGNTLCYNIITTSYGNAGINITNDISGDNTNHSNFQILNNVIYNTYYGIAIGQSISGTIKNNICWSSATATKARISVGPIVAGQTLTMDNNIWLCKGPTDVMEHTGGVDYYTLPAWQTATGYDTHSGTANPLFVSSGSANFHLQTGSPAIDAGANVGLTADFEGNPVPQGLAPDIGAYESGGLDAYEGFNYATGDITGANGGIGWASSWSVSGGAGSQQTVSPGFTYTGLPATGNRFQIYDTDGSFQNVTRTLSKTFGAAPETYWISFLAKKLSNGREIDVYFGNMIFKSYQSSDWQVKTPTTAFTTLTGAGYSALHFFLVRVDAAATSDTVRVWVDPVIASGEPSTASALVTLTDSTPFSFNKLTISHGPYGNATQCGELDEFRLGSSFKSVTSGP